MAQPPSRRAFLEQLGAGLAAPYVLTSGALGAGAKAPASDRIVTGHIGVGGMGGGHVRQISGRRDATIGAVCDVDEGRCYNAQRRASDQCKAYHDFRELLDQRDIDAVIVASPDHWHALHTLLACHAGKDVYCQKPMMKTIREGQAMVRAARRFGRVVQIGTQGRSTVHSRASVQFIRNGHCGRVHTVRTWHYNNPTHRWEPPRPVPKGLDWDLWLGPARWVPYHPRRCHGTFRWFMDFGGGQIRDRGAHIFTNVCWAMDVDDTGPVSVECLSGTQPPGMYDCPNDFEVRYEFKDPGPPSRGDGARAPTGEGGWTLLWRQPGEAYGPHRFGMKFFGTTDDLVLMGGDSGIRAVEKALRTKPGRNEFRLPEINDHMGNFLDCVRSREKPVMDVAIGHRVTSLCILGNISFAVGRKLRWDPAREEFVGDEAANRLLHYPYRPPWRLL